MIHQKFNKILLLFLLLICYSSKIEGGNVGEDGRDGGKIKGSGGEIEGGKGGELVGIRDEIESGKEEQIEVKGGGGKGGKLEQGGGELGGIRGEIESGEEGQIERGKGQIEGSKGGKLEQVGVGHGGIKSDIERGEEDKIEVKGGERVPEQFVKKSDKETKSLKKVWGKIENKTEAIKDEIKYENDFPSLIDSKNVTKKTMKYKYLSAKKGEKSLKIT